MISFKTSARLISAFVLVFALSASLLPLPSVSAQQQATATAAKQDYSAALAAIEKALDDKRKELGIPGISIAIVKDDQIIYLKGLGEKDVDKKLPVTPDTRFAIGSASKAFTGMLAVMSADDGKLSLDDSPKKFLPYFTLRDQEAAAKITLRDLLAHRSGLNRTDFAMVTGMLNREELIRVAGLAKPTAKLGEKFQYQNIMYAAAGEAVAKAENSTWDKLIATRIFKPLGMNNSDTSSMAMQKARDYSFGYDYNPTTKVTRRLPQRAIPAAAPAGAINSSARDMAQWVRLMLNNGTYNGKRLVSEKNFDELVHKQMAIGGPVSYGLGWFLREWKGHKIVEHGGNIDGFNSQVAFMPDQKLGFVLLTNVTASSLGAFAMNTIWKEIVGEPKTDEATNSAPAHDPKMEVGTYKMDGAPVSLKVSFTDNKLMLSVPGQPSFQLHNIGGRRYKLGDPAPAGYFCTFRPAKDKASETEMFLEQPQGNVVATRQPVIIVDEPPRPAAKPISADELLAKMIDAYGGEANIRKHKSSITTVELDLESQGMKGEGKLFARVPNLNASEMTFTALDKKVAQIITFFDGNGGGEVMTFGPPETYSGKRLDDIRTGSDVYDVVNWKNNYKTITVKPIIDKVGDEDVYVVQRRPEKGTAITDYVSTKSFLVLKRDSVIVSETAGIEIPQTQTFSDYRSVDGVMVAFKTTSSNIANGDITMRVLDVKFDADIPDAVFHKPANPPKRTDQ
jgi:CubicO group peptidase (beta-lactamase class C family)